MIKDVLGLISTVLNAEAIPERSFDASFWSVCTMVFCASRPPVRLISPMIAFLKRFLLAKMTLPSTPRASPVLVPSDSMVKVFVFEGSSSTTDRS